MGLSRKEKWKSNTFMTEHLLDGLKKFVKSNLDLLVDKLNSTDNYGLAFLACGYNGQAQNDFIDYWEKQGVSIF